MISETKLDKSFSIGQFQIEGFSTPYRRDRDKNGSDILLHVREDIPFKLLSFKNDGTKIKHFFIEINPRKKKKLLGCSYNPHSNFDQNGFDHFSGKFDNFILLGNFNSEISNKYLKAFCKSYILKVLIKNPTRFKNHDKSTCIDLILKN